MNKVKKNFLENVDYLILKELRLINKNLSEISKDIKDLKNEIDSKNDK